MIALLVACVSPHSGGGVALDGYVTDVTVEPTEVPTVLRVSWRTETPSRGVVSALFGDDVVTVTEAAAATEHEVLVAGIPAITDLEVVVEATGDEGESGVAGTLATTGALPTSVPDVTFTADAPERSEGGLVVVPVVASEGGLVSVFDRLGRPVWAWPPEGADKSASIVRARRSLDGRAMLYNSMAPSVDEPGPITRVSLDGAQVTSVEIVGAHTDFVETEDGVYAALTWDLREIGERKILGDSIVEIDANGTTRTVWSVWDDFDPDLTRTYDHWYPADEEVESWSHINGITYAAEDDAYYVTMTFNDGVARVDRASGEMTWWIDANGGAFVYEGEEPVMVQPHSVQRIDDGLLVFSRGEPTDPEACSEAVDLVVDEGAMTVARGATLGSERCMLVTYLGSAQRLPAGNTLVTWTTAGQIDEFTADGALAWRVNSAIGAAFGFSERVERLAPAEQ